MKTLFLTVITLAAVLTSLAAYAAQSNVSPTSVSTDRYAFINDKTDYPNLQLCNGFLQILKAPENKDFIISGENLNEEQLIKRINGRRDLIFPKKMKNFKAVEWADVSNEEVKNKLSDYKEKSESGTVFKKAEIDLNLNGKVETIYLKTGQHPHVIASQDQVNLKSYFEAHSSSYLNMFFYKNKPYFINTNDMRVSAISVDLPAWIQTAENQQKLFSKNVCYYRLQKIQEKK